jgi:hypothetical protein
MILQPDGSFLRLRAEPPAVAELSRLLGGQPSANGSSPRVADLLQHFTDQGLLAETDPSGTEEPPGGAPVHRVAVLGAGLVAAELARLLGKTGLAVERRPLEEAPPVDAVAVVACAGWLLDRRFAELDAWCEEHGAAWHSHYAEGLCHYLGPFAAAGDAQAPRYRDTRARRLAAADQPELLADYWRYLEGGGPVPPVPELRPSGAAALAGALAEDLIAHLAGGPVPSSGYQMAFDPRTFSWHRHSVLPVPQGLLSQEVP